MKYKSLADLILLIIAIDESLDLDTDSNIDNLIEKLKSHPNRCVGIG